MNVYKNKGWISIGDWLGTNRIATQNRVYYSIEDAKKFVHKLNLKSQKEWLIYKQGKLKGKKQLLESIPRNPYKVYRDNGWISWPDFLGYEPKQKKK